MTDKGEGLDEVFPAIGQPTVTYVKRRGGEYENVVMSALDKAGQICLISGPSKTGKTSLYRKVLKDRAIEPIVVRGGRSITGSEIWLRALEQLNAERVSQRSREREIQASGAGKVGGGFGLKWLTNLVGELAASGTVARTTGETREAILATPSAEHLAARLKDSGRMLVIEDFQYLEDNVKVDVFQSFKTFTDSGICVIVLGTTHHAGDIASANRDLVGRISHIRVAAWARDDLKQIAVKGFQHLGLPVPDDVTTTLGSESVGLPIIAQQLCRQVVVDLGGADSPDARTRSAALRRVDIHRSLRQVAEESYSELEETYRAIARGPSARPRKYNTYELVLLSFNLDPVTFALERPELDRRLQRLVRDPDLLPPAATVTNTLRSLNRMSAMRNEPLLEWIDTTRTLHILEPAFLFYLRWRRMRDSEQPMNASSYVDLLREWQKSF